ncbi:hypothetical protein GQ43DRAFT_96400 [Delitschia confertaspora ATCC 74209]|uniref:Uncharacterized protein n=1 Tax=Delitschia confertaspora ATCC 74209 TaxID=1513339 RepID=A0A9P4MXK6_9PLEO|nr:hypothetical protein GQ43DRAFT_96400 [Delitschia confertaspora ATCC 74209]
MLQIVLLSSSLGVPSISTWFAQSFITTVVCLHTLNCCFLSFNLPSAQSTATQHWFSSFLNCLSRRKYAIPLLSAFITICRSPSPFYVLDKCFNRSVVMPTYRTARNGAMIKKKFAKEQNVIRVSPASRNTVTQNGIQLGPKDKVLNATQHDGLAQHKVYNTRSSRKLAPQEDDLAHPQPQNGQTKAFVRRRGEKSTAGAYKPSFTAQGYGLTPPHETIPQARRSQLYSAFSLSRSTCDLIDLSPNMTTYPKELAAQSQRKGNQPPDAPVPWTITSTPSIESIPLSTEASAYAFWRYCSTLISTAVHQASAIPHLPLLSAHDLAVWGQRLPRTHPINGPLIGRVLLPPPPKPCRSNRKSQFTGHDDRPTDAEIHAAVDRYTKALSMVDIEHLLQETDFLLCLLRWHNSSLSPVTESQVSDLQGKNSRLNYTGVVMREFTVSWYDLESEDLGVERCAWREKMGVLRQGLEWGNGRWCWLRWVKEGVEEGWAALVPRIPGWGGAGAGWVDS